MFGLKITDINLINSVFTKYNCIKKVIIYGSRAKGNYKKGSDIDLTLIGKNISLTTQMKIENELDELFLPYKIDLSVYDKIENIDLKDHIQRIGSIFYKKK